MSETLPGLAEEVYAALFEKDAPRRAQARERLAAHRGPHDSVVMGLAGGMRGNDDCRLRAIEALQALGPRAASASAALAQLVATDPQLSIRVAAAHARACVDPAEALDPAPFAMALVLGERDERHDAIALLGSLGPVAAPAIPLLVKVCESDDLVARQQATLALSRIGIDALAAVLKCRAVSSRRHAVLLLDRRHGELSRAVPLLVSALADKDADVRRAAAVALGRCGAWARCAIPSLQHAMRDRDGEVRWWSALAAATMGVSTRDVVTGLLEARDRAPVDLRDRATGLLSRMGWAALAAA